MALALAAAAPAAAWADDEAEDRARAQALLSEGDEHLSRGDALRERGDTERAAEAYEQALAAYQEAFDAFPSTRIYYPIGRAEEQLGRYRNAYQYYERVLDDEEEIGDRLRAELENRQESVRVHIASLRPNLVPAEAEISIDGEPLGRGPFDDPILLDAGEHSVEVSADGHVSRQLDIEAEAGATMSLVVALKPEIDLGDSDDEPALDPADLAAPGDGKRSRAPLVAGLSVTAGFGLAATVTGLASISRHGTFTDDARPADERQSARETGQILAVSTDVLLIATAAAASYTAYYYYAEYRSGGDALSAGGDEASAQQSSIWVSPYGDEDGGGLALGGRF